MSSRIVYLGRTAGGGVLRGVRVIGERTSDAWDAALGEAVDPVDAIEQARTAAGWIAERLKAGSATRHATLVVDVDGAACSWLTVPSAEASVVAAAMEQSDGSPLGEHGLAPAGVTSAGASVQAIGAPAANGSVTTVAGERRAVLCMPDSIVRIVIDRLDALGVAPRSVISMWHAISLAWDPSAARSGGVRQDRVVADSEQTTGVVVIDEGTLLWTWTRGGRLLTCGRQRLEHNDEQTSVAAQDISRLTTDWISWSLQNGQSPSRIVCVAPELGPDGLTCAEVGERLGGAWPDASISMGVVDEPLQETLERLAGQETTIPETIDALARRPGRVHRRLHLAMAAAAVVLGILLGVHGWLQRDTAARAKAETLRVSDAMFLRAQEVIPDIQRQNVQGQVQATLARMNGAGPRRGEIDRAMPILNELRVIADALSMTGANWDKIELISHETVPIATIDAIFDKGDIESMDLLREQLNLMPESNVTGWRGDVKAFGSQREKLNLKGRWKVDEE